MKTNVDREPLAKVLGRGNRDRQRKMADVHSVGSKRERKIKASRLGFPRTSPPALARRLLPPNEDTSVRYAESLIVRRESVGGVDAVDDQNERAERSAALTDQRAESKRVYGIFAFS